MKPSDELKLKDDFLSDPDNLHYEITCVECKKPIWQTKILKRSGADVMSTETKKVGHDIDFNRRIEWCPLCGKKFYSIGHMGIQMYLIKDLHSGKRRLI